MLQNPEIRKKTKNHPNGAEDLERFKFGIGGANQLGIRRINSGTTGFDRVNSTM